MSASRQSPASPPAPLYFVAMYTGRHAEPRAAFTRYGLVAESPELEHAPLTAMLVAAFPGRSNRWLLVTPDAGAWLSWVATGTLDPAEARKLCAELQARRSSQQWAVIDLAPSARVLQ